MGFIRTKIMVKRITNRIGQFAPEADVWRELAAYLAWGRRPGSDLAHQLLARYLAFREALGPAASTAGEMPRFALLREGWEKFVACCEPLGGMDRGELGRWMMLMLGADWALARTVEMAMDPGRRWRAVAREVHQLLEGIHDQLLSPAISAAVPEQGEGAREAA